MLNYLEYSINMNTCFNTKILSILYISKSKDFKYYFMIKKPNIWWRFWQYILLGWGWEDVK